MEKHLFLIYAKNRGGRSASEYALADQCLCFFIVLWNAKKLNMHFQKIKVLASLCSWTGKHQPLLAENPEDMFSCKGAQL